jgi:hypothetical protein
LAINFHAMRRLPRLSSGVNITIDLLSARFLSVRSPSHQPLFYRPERGPHAPIHCRYLR